MRRRSYYKSSIIQFSCSSPTFNSSLPMADTFTPDSKSIDCHSEQPDQRLTPRPKKSTLEFIRQFARCYVHEPQLKPSIADLIIN